MHLFDKYHFKSSSKRVILKASQIKRVNNMTDRDSFYIDDHAVLYALLAKNVKNSCGELSDKILEAAVTAYGKERGLRSAKRCLADGEELSGANFILYGEWADPRGLSKNETDTGNPWIKTRMTTCGWCEAWKKYNMLEDGKSYCSWVDASLLHGFNPALRLEMSKVLSHGDEWCEFDWLDADAAAAKSLPERRRELIPRVTKDFLYHSGHLLSVFRRELYFELGLLRGADIIKQALSDYGALFGDEKASAVLEESEQNFLTGV